MKTLVALIALSTVSGIASADGFQPWADRGIVDAVATDIPAQGTFNGFAPWRERTVPVEESGEHAEFAASPTFGFRPWS